MNAVDRFAISYLVSEISTFKQLPHHAATTTIATLKIVTSTGFHVDQ